MRQGRRHAFGRGDRRLWLGRTEAALFARITTTVRLTLHDIGNARQEHDVVDDAKTVAGFEKGLVDFDCVMLNWCIGTQLQTLPLQPERTLPEIEPVDQMIKTVGLRARDAVLNRHAELIKIV